MINRRERAPFRPPLSVQEAERRRGMLRTEIHNIEQQLADPALAAHKRAQAGEEGYERWRRVATKAKLHLSTELAILGRWVEEFGSKKGGHHIKARVIALETANVRLVELLRRAHVLFTKLREKSIAFDPGEIDLIEIMGTSLAPFPFDALDCARACYEIVQGQKRVEIALAIALYTKDPEDMEQLHRALTAYLGVRTEGSDRELCEKLVNAFLARHKVGAAIRVAQALAHTPCAHHIRAWTRIYAQSKNPEHLERAMNLVSSAKDAYDIILGWGYISLVSKNGTEWSRATKLLSSFLRTEENEKRMDGLLISLTGIMCEAGKKEEACQFADKIRDPWIRTNALCQIARDFQVLSCLREALGLLQGDTKAIPFGPFRTMAKLCMDFGILDGLQTIGEKMPEPLNYCAWAFTATMVSGETRSALLDRAVKAMHSNFAAGGEFNGFWPAVVSCIAWAVAVCGDIALAMEIAGNIPDGHRRCVSYLAIDAVQRGKTSIADTQI